MDDVWVRDGIDRLNAKIDRVDQGLDERIKLTVWNSLLNVGIVCLNILIWLALAKVFSQR